MEERKEGERRKKKEKKNKKKKKKKSEEKDEKKRKKTKSRERANIARWPVSHRRRTESSLHNVMNDYGLDA